MKKFTGIYFYFLFNIFFVLAQQKTNVIASFEAKSGDYERTNAAVCANITGLGIVEDATDIQLFEITQNESRPITYQIEIGGQVDLLWWVLDGKTKPGAIRIYELRKTSKTSSFDKITIQDNNEAIHFKIADQNILGYHYGLTTMPAGVPDIYRRGGYIHPLWSPKGEVLTRIQPPDHYHHYGIWNPWTHTEYAGREIDFWNLNKGQGTVKVAKKPSVDQGYIFGKLRAFHQHIAKKTEAQLEDKIAMNEDWEIRVWNVDPEKKIWLVDFMSTLSCGDNEPLTIKKYRYQGFGFRANKNWNDQTATLTTSEGKDKSTANGTRARWCDVKGPSANGTAGIVFMNHKANFNSPQQLRIWPTGMNDGKENVFVNFNPAQDRDWYIEPGKTYTLRYRMIVYDGSISKEKIENYWNDYANPPLVTIVN